MVKKTTTRPEESSTEPASSEDSHEGSTPSTPSISKTEAVRKALEAGKEKPKEGVAWIKEKFGLDVGPNYFSSMKTSFQKKPGEGPKKTSNPTGMPGKVSEADSLIKDLETLRALKERYGEDGLQRILDAMG